MLKNISKLEHVIEGKVYSFLCEMDASLVHVKESLFQFQKFIGQVEDQHKAIQIQQEAEKSAQEAPKEVPLEPKPE